MCIIVDMNTFAAVFNPSDAGHNQFRPVFEHIDNGKSALIVGGTTYMAELSQLGKYTKLLAELRRAAKLVQENDSDVDALEAKISSEFPDPLFNDKHIVALAYVSKARLICTKDKVLQTYLKSRNSYNRGKTIPKIYNESTRPSALPTGSFNPKCRLC